MGIQAARRASKIGGAFRAWVLGKALDAPGLGMVKRDELQAFALSLGMNLRTWQRWVNEARDNDLLIDIQKGEDWYFILPNPGRVALAMGLENIGNRKAIIDLSLLVSKGWKARVFSAWEDGKQIAREQIQKTVNVSVSTQRYRDDQAGTERQRNYAKSRMTADKLPGLKEHSNHKGLFVMRCGVIGFRVPDTRHSTVTERGTKGRARKINRFIRNSQQEGLSNMRQALTDEVKPEYIRLFNLTEAQRLDTQRKISRRDLLVLDLYQQAQEARSGAMIWTHYPIMG